MAEAAACTLCMALQGTVCKHICLIVEVVSQAYVNNGVQFSLLRSHMQFVQSYLTGLAQVSWRWTRFWFNSLFGRSSAFALPLPQDSPYFKTASLRFLCSTAHDHHQKWNLKSPSVLGPLISLRIMISAHRVRTLICITTVTHEV